MFNKIQYIKNILLHPEYMEHKFLQDLLVLIFLGILVLMNKIFLINIMPATIFLFVNGLLIGFIICIIIRTIFHFISIRKDD